jgi:hypothetical protein
MFVKSRRFVIGAGELLSQLHNCRHAVVSSLSKGCVPGSWLVILGVSLAPGNSNSKKNNEVEQWRARFLYVVTIDGFAMLA